MKSKKKLFEFLNNRFGTNLNLKSDGVSADTYGRDSRIYLWNVDKLLGINREYLEGLLCGAGFKVHPSYHPGSNNVEVSVSYFKGWHWNE